MIASASSTLADVDRIGSSNRRPNNYLIRDAKLGTLQEVSDEDRTIPGSAPGDLVLYDWEEDGSIDHIAVTVSTDSNETLVAQHTNNYIDTGWNWPSLGRAVAMASAWEALRSRRPTRT